MGCLPMAWSIMPRCHSTPLAGLAVLHLAGRAVLPFAERGAPAHGCARTGALGGANGSSRARLLDQRRMRVVARGGVGGAPWMLDPAVVGHASCMQVARAYELAAATSGRGPSGAGQGQPPLPNLSGLSRHEAAQRARHALPEFTLPRKLANGVTLVRWVSRSGVVCHRAVCGRSCLHAGGCLGPARFPPNAPTPPTRSLGDIDDTACTSRCLLPTGYSVSLAGPDGIEILCTITTEPKCRCAGARWEKSRRRCGEMRGRREEGEWMDRESRGGPAPHCRTPVAMIGFGRGFM